MAKDAKGHGSEKRGGSYHNIERSAFRKGQHVGYGDGTFRISKSGGGYTAAQQNGTDLLFGRSLGHISQQLSDRAAARALAAPGNAKSVAAPVHPDAAGRSDTVSRITLGGKIKETMSGADYTKRGGKFPSDK